MNIKDLILSNFKFLNGTFALIGPPASGKTNYIINVIKAVPSSCEIHIFIREDEGLYSYAKNEHDNIIFHYENISPLDDEVYNNNKKILLIIDYIAHKSNEAYRDTIKKHKSKNQSVIYTEHDIGNISKFMLSSTDVIINF